MNTTKIGLLIGTFLLSSCAVQVPHEKTEFQNKAPENNSELELYVPIDTTNYVEKNALQGWNYEIGAAIQDVFPKAMKNYFNEVSLTSTPCSIARVVPCLEIRLNSYTVDLGSFVWNAHEATLVLDYKFYNEGREYSGTIENSKFDSAAQFFETYFPITTNQSVKKSLGRVMSKAVLGSVLELGPQLILKTKQGT